MDTKEFLSDLTAYMKYSRYLPDKKRREDWNELVTINKEMHLMKFKDHHNFLEIRPYIDEAYRMVYEREVLPSMRSLQSEVTGF